MRNYIDLLVPRGGADLIRFVTENATMAVVTGGIGVCHAYIDKSGDGNKAVAIIYNAKVQRPTVCNALDCVLIHKNIAKAYLPQIVAALGKAGVELHCDKKAISTLKTVSGIKIVAAKKEDWGKEFLALIMAIKVVDSTDQALEHIEKYGSGHSETIITED